MLATTGSTYAFEIVLPSATAEFSDMFIGTGDKHDIKALEAFIACHRIGCYRRVRVADMQFVTGIVYRSRNVECRFQNASLLVFQMSLPL